MLSLVGPRHVIEFANAGFRQQLGVSDPVGKPYLEALPGAADQYTQAYQATDLYDHIYRTGEPYYAAEAPYYVDPTQSGQRELRYFTFAAQAARDGTGRIAGVQAFATDVTEQVRARQQVQTLNEELAAANEELAAANEEFLTGNAALGQAQQQLQQLNQDLEARVQARTQEALILQADLLAAARRQADQQTLLYEVFAQTPAPLPCCAAPATALSTSTPLTRPCFPRGHWRAARWRTPRLNWPRKALGRCWTASTTPAKPTSGPRRPLRPCR